MKHVLTDDSLSDSNESFSEKIRHSLEMNSALKRCQSLILLQRMLILKANQNSGVNIKKEDLEKNYEMEIDKTEKNNVVVINDRIKNIFNMNNYVQNIKKEAWKKDLSKIYLGLGDEKGNNYNEFIEYNFEKRDKKKEGLNILKNFFGKLKSVKKIQRYKKKDKSKENILNLNKFEKYFYHIKDKNQKNLNINDLELNLILNKLKDRFNLKNDKEDKKENKTVNREILHGKNRTNFITEINHKDYYFNNINKKKKVVLKKKLFNSKYHLKNKIINTESNINNGNKNKLLFPKIRITHEVPKKEIKTISSAHKDNKSLKNRKGNISDKNIFNKNKNKIQITKSINRNKTYLEQLKNIYSSERKRRENFMKNNMNNYEMPELLKYREKPLFKKKNKLFFSPLHYSKYEQLREIKDKLTGTTGLLDKEVFKEYNQNI